MARPKSSGINVATKKRRDGSTLSYFYDRSTGAFLGHDRAAAEQRIRAEAERAPAGWIRTIAASVR